MNRPGQPPRDADALLEQWAEISGRARPPAIDLVRRSGGAQLLPALATATAAVVVVALVTVALLLHSSPAAMPATPPPFEVVRAETVDHPFRLVFEMPRTTWREGEAIEGLARLELIDGDRIVIGPPLGGPLGFSFVEVEGDRQVLPVHTGCGSVELEAADPIVLEITKSGDWWSDNREGDFYRDFVAEPEVRLPAGEWEISATASFHEGGCRGPDRHLSVTIRISVEP